jgi:hypothetical protein
VFVFGLADLLRVNDLLPSCLPTRVPNGQASLHSVGSTRDGASSLRLLGRSTLRPPSTPSFGLLWQRVDFALSQCSPSRSPFRGSTSRLCQPSGGNTSGSRSPSRGSVSTSRPASLCDGVSHLCPASPCAWAPTPRVLRQRLFQPCLQTRCWQFPRLGLVQCPQSAALPLVHSRVEFPRVHVVDHRFTVVLTPVCACQCMRGRLPSCPHQ